MCSDTTHPSQSTNSISLCSYKHNIVCKRPICSWQIEANERSDSSLSKHYTINSFSTKILKIQNNPLCSRLRLKTKLRKKKKVSSPGSYIAPWAVQLTRDATGNQVGMSLPSPSDQPALVLPPLLHARTALWAAMRAAAAHRACLSREQSIIIQFAAQIAATLNAEFPSGLKMPQKGQQSKPWQPDMRGACGRQTYGLTAATPYWWRWDGMGWALGWNSSPRMDPLPLLGTGPAWQQPASRGAGPTPSPLHQLSLWYQERSEVTAVIQAEEVNHEDTSKGRTRCLSSHSSRSEAGFLLPCCDSVSVTTSAACTAQQSCVDSVQKAFPLWPSSDFLVFPKVKSIKW